MARRAARVPVIDEAGMYVGLVTADELLHAGSGAIVAEVADTAAAVLAPGDSLQTSGPLGGRLVPAAVVAFGRVVGLARAADAAHVAQRMVQQSTATTGHDRD